MSATLYTSGQINPDKNRFYDPNLDRIFSSATERVASEVGRVPGKLRTGQLEGRSYYEAFVKAVGPLNTDQPRCIGPDLVHELWRRGQWEFEAHEGIDKEVFCAVRRFTEACAFLRLCIMIE